jgi:hypothetical protein
MHDMKRKERRFLTEIYLFMIIHPKAFVVNQMAIIENIPIGRKLLSFLIDLLKMKGFKL